MVIHAPLDVEYWINIVFSGNTLISTFVLLAFIAFLAAKFKMETSVFTIFLILFAAIMLATGDSALLILAILVGVLILFLVFRRALE